MHLCQTCRSTGLEFISECWGLDLGRLRLWKWCTENILVNISAISWGRWWWDPTSISILNRFWTFKDRGHTSQCCRASQWDGWGRWAVGSCTWTCNEFGRGLVEVQVTKVYLNSYLGFSQKDFPLADWPRCFFFWFWFWWWKPARQLHNGLDTWSWHVGLLATGCHVSHLGQAAFTASRAAQAAQYASQQASFTCKKQMRWRDMMTYDCGMTPIIESSFDTLKSLNTLWFSIEFRANSRRRWRPTLHRTCKPWPGSWTGVRQWNDASATEFYTTRPIELPPTNPSVAASLLPGGGTGELLDE